MAASTTATAEDRPRGFADSTRSLNSAVSWGAIAAGAAAAASLSLIRERPAVPRQATLISPGLAAAASDEAASRRCGC